MKRLELGELAGFMSFEPTEFAWLLDHTCGWLCKEPAPLRISHAHSGDVGDRVVDSTRDLLAIAGIPELVRRQRSRIAHGILDALESFCGIEPMSRRAHCCRLLLELCGVCNKVAGAASTQGGQLLRQLQKDVRAGCFPTNAFTKTPFLLRSLWERAERTGIDWKALIETGELARYQRADKRYSDMADFRENKEGAGDWLASIQSVAAEFGPPHSGDWGLVYAFLSEFVHPNLGAFIESEEEHSLGEITHPHLEIGILLDPSYGRRMDGDCTVRHAALATAVEMHLLRVLRDVILLSGHLSAKLRREEQVLRAICQALIRSTLDYFDDSELARARSFLPTGRCICLQAVAPEGCCFRVDHRET